MGYEIGITSFSFIPIVRTAHTECLKVRERQVVLATQTRTHADTQTHRHTDTDSQTNPKIHRLTDTKTHRLTEKPQNTQTHRQTPKYTDKTILVKQFTKWNSKFTEYI